MLPPMGYPGNVSPHCPIHKTKGTNKETHPCTSSHRRLIVGPGLLLTRCLRRRRSLRLWLGWWILGPVPVRVGPIREAPGARRHFPIPTGVASILILREQRCPQGRWWRVDLCQKRWRVDAKRGCTIATFSTHCAHVMSLEALRTPPLCRPRLPMGWILRPRPRRLPWP